MTIKHQVIRIETSLLNLFKKTNSRGFSFCDTRVNLSVKTPSCNESQEKVSVLYAILRAQYFCFCLLWEFLFAACWSFVCSVREFCLQLVILLFAACWSFVCNVREVCLQRVILLIASWWSFVCSARESCLKRVILLLVVCIYLFTVLICLQYAGDDFF